MTEDALQTYFLETAEAELANAKWYASQKRRAKAQEALREAKYWAIKCWPADTKRLQDSIAVLDYELNT